MKKLLSVLLIALCAVAMVGCSGSQGGEETATEDPVLVIYSPNSDTVMDTIIPAFEEATGIECQVLSLGTGEVLARLQEEAANPQCDVWFGGWNTGQAVQHPEVCQEYVSPYDKNFPEGYQNYKGLVSHYACDGSAALLVNTKVLGELGLTIDDVKGYADLLNPALKGHIAMGNAGASSSAWAELTNMLLVMGTDAYSDDAWTYVEQLMDQMNGVMLDSSSAIYKNTAAGEYAVGISYEDPCAALINSGAENLALVYPEEGSVWLPAGSGIVANCPHVNNAKKFIDFLQSDEGQALFAKTTMRPCNQAFENETLKPLSEIKVAYENIEFCAQQKAAWQEKWTNMWSSNN